MEYKIYKLTYENKVVYIGRTKRTLEKRKSGGYKGTGVEDIAKDCDIELIEETDDVRRERFWIEEYIKMGYKLYNKLKGDGHDYKEYGKNWNKENKNYFKEYNKKYREENKDYYKEYKKKWYENQKIKNGIF